MCVLDIKLVSTAHTYQCFSGFYLEGDFVYFGLLAKWCCKNCKNAHSLGHTFAQHFYHHQLANWGWIISEGALHKYIKSPNFTSLSIHWHMNGLVDVQLKDGFCIWFFCPRTHPKTFLECFALEQREYKEKHCRNVLGHVLGRKN